LPAWKLAAIEIGFWASPWLIELVTQRGGHGQWSQQLGERSKAHTPLPSIVRQGAAHMYEHGAKRNSRGAIAQEDRRNADRHMFTASAEVVELSSGARFSTRTTDLGPGGCFVDTMLPFPVGAKVRVSVRKGQTTFETGGVVVYSQTGLGMGIAFSGMEPQQRDALDTWLGELTGMKQAAAPLSPPRNFHAPAPAKAQSSATVARLVHLMITKGLITEAEGASILHDPLL